MAGEWIKMRTNLWDDPRISKLCDITDQSEAAIVGGLYWLWAMADEHTESGILPGLTSRAIDRKTGVQGLGQGLVDIGWLADHPEGVRIVGFEEHNGTSAKKRCQTAKRVEKHKTGNAEVTQQALANEAESVSGALPREEKRREEKKEDQKPSSPSGDGKPVKPDPLQGFGAFWIKYPRKTAKQDAEKAWAKLKPDADLQSILITAVDRQAKSLDWTKDGGKFIPHPATWLNGKRWDDQLTAAPLSKHGDFEKRDYYDGLTQREDGSYAF